MHVRARPSPQMFRSIVIAISLASAAAFVTPSAVPARSGE